MAKRNRTKKDSANKTNNPIEKADVKRTTTAEYGISGLPMSFGKVKKDTREYFRGINKIKMLEEMVRFNPTVGAFNNMYVSTANTVSWSTLPADDSDEAKAVKTFIDECLGDMAIPLDRVVKDALTAPQYGFALAEIVYKVRNGHKNNVEKTSKYNDGKIGIAKLAPRYQGSINKWNYDNDNRKIVSVEQKNPFNFEFVEIPYDKLLHFTFRSNNQDPEGNSIYTNCVDSFKKIKDISALENIRYERGFDGLLTITTEDYILDPNTQDPRCIEIQRQLRDMAQNIRCGTDGAVVLPRYIDIDIKNAGQGNIPDANQIIDRENRNMAVSLLSDYFVVSQKSGTSGGLSQSKIQFFINVIKEILDDIATELNTKLIIPLCEKNLIDPKLAPILKYSEIGDLDLTNLLLFIQSADKSGLVPNTREMCNVVLKRILGKDAPEFTEEQWKDWITRREVNTVGQLSEGEAGKLLPKITRE